MATRRAFLTSLLACAAAGLTFRSAALLAGSRLRVVASTYPVWLLARPLAASSPAVELGLLVQAMAGCPHDYSLTPQDMLKLSAADMLVCNGGGFEPFLDGVLKGLPTLSVADAGREVPRHEGGVARAACAHPGHEGGHAHDHDLDGHDDGNPHYFASPLRAAAMARTLAADLAARLPGDAAALREAGERLAGRLEELGARVALLGRDAGSVSFILQHDALSWLFHDAGLPVTAVLQADEDEQPSAAELVGLVKAVRADTVRRHVLVAEPQFPERVVAMLAAETGAPVITLDPLASGPEDAPIDYYFDVMEANLAALRACLASARGE